MLEAEGLLTFDMGLGNDVLEGGSMEKITHFLYSQTLLDETEEDDGVADLLEVTEEIDLEVRVLGDVLEMR